MKQQYQAIQEFWNTIFRESLPYEPGEPISVKAIEQSLTWLSENSRIIIDYGCGSGRLVLRCLALGAQQIVAFDIAEEAIALANRVVRQLELQDQATFIVGGVEQLLEMETNSVDGAILSNILDNLFPEDMDTVIQEINRIVKPGGRLLLKFNPYITEAQQKECEMKEISANFFEETTGLFLWNLNEEQLTAWIEQYFTIESAEEVYFEQFDQTNRLFRVTTFQN